MFDKFPKAIVASIQAFIAFRVCFNARFYYPVFMILFLDFGLSVDEFSLLNAIWAAAIIMLEVPSGALADIVGRRNLVIAAAVLMVLEMAVLIALPLDAGHEIILTAFILNRILSGAAEAAASGADEALVYDSLGAQGAEQYWPAVLETLGKAMAIAMFSAMLIGSLVFDPNIWNGAFTMLGLDLEWSKLDTVKLPLWLCLLTACGALYSAIRMKETNAAPERPHAHWNAIGGAFRSAFKTGKWVLGQRPVWLVIAGAMLLDHVARFGATITSEYLRLSGYPEFTLGPIGSIFALIGIPLAVVARSMIEKQSPMRNALTLAAVTLAALVGLGMNLGFAGIIFIVLLFSVMDIVNPVVSSYLNRLTPSHTRATVLSFKGLALNLAYGGFGLLYAWIFAANSSLHNTDGSIAFLQSLKWLPPYFLCALVVFGVVITLRKTNLRAALADAGDGDR